jgi:nitrate reductase NapE component
MMSPIHPLAALIVGVLGFAMIGYVHVHLAEGKRFAEQTSSARKRAIVFLAFAQWPYLALGGFGAFDLIYPYFK